MNKQALRSDLLLLITSCIWGFAFVAQRSGMEYIGPFTFNGIRFALGSLSLIPLILYRKRKHPHGRETSSKRRFILASLAAGTCLFLGASLQQIGIIYTTAGNAGFITGLYVVLVPIFGMCIGRKTGIPTWMGAAFTLAGLFFLSGAKDLNRINYGDALVAVSALFWALHVLVIDKLVKTIDPVVLSAGQFGWCSLFSLMVAFFTEPFNLSSVRDAWLPILYGGFCSVGIAYTLQAIAQRNAPPAHATIILCLEGVFAALGGVLILSEPLASSTLAGFILILIGMLTTQWDVIRDSAFKPKAKKDQ